MLIFLTRIWKNGAKANELVFFLKIHLFFPVLTCRIAFGIETARKKNCKGK
jgi:hypothetical protein